MNPKPTPERLAYRQQQLAERLPDIGPDNRLENLPEDSVIAAQHAAAAAHRIRKKPVPDQTHTQKPPEKLPDPWMFDSETLLRELDRCRELVLQIPATTHAAHFASNIAIDALWNLRYTLQFLLQLRAEGQNAFAKKAEKPVVKPRAVASRNTQRG